MVSSTAYSTGYFTTTAQPGAVPLPTAQKAILNSFYLLLTFILNNSTIDL